MKMTVLAIQNNKTIAASKGRERSSKHVHSEKAQTTVAPFVPGKIELLCPEIFNGKVRTVRQQLTEGRYDTKGRLDIAFDRLLDELFGKEDKTRIPTLY
jgi:hypothetical protein